MPIVFPLFNAGGPAISSFARPPNNREPSTMSDFQSYTVKGFCAAERISRGMLYKLWSEGKGPHYYLVGTVRRISP